MLLDVCDCFRHLPEDYCLELVRDFIWKIELHIGFDPCQGTEHKQAVADCFFEPTWQLERRRAELEQEPAGRVFGLPQQSLRILDRRELGCAHALEVKLCGSQLLEGVVVELGGESTA